MRTVMAMSLAAASLLGAAGAEAAVPAERAPQRTGPMESVSVASPWALADTQGDTTNAAGDITAIKVEHLSSSLRLTTRTRVGSNPGSSSAWVSGFAEASWRIDANNDGLTDFDASIYYSLGSVRADVYRRSNGSRACLANWSHPTSTTFVITIPRACLSSRLSYRVIARMDFPTPGLAPRSNDYSPNAAWSPRVTR